MTKNITISNVNLSSRFFLAPMAGYTDYAFRKLARRFGAGLVVTELVSAPALSRQIKKTYGYLKRCEEETPLSLQIFGSNPDEFKIAIEKHIDMIAGVDGGVPFSFIDINMGCPTKKVVRSGSGSAILTDTNKMIDIIRAVKSVSPVPVSVKIRLGYKQGEGGMLERAIAISEEKPAFITVHGRYASQMYLGVADWQAIGEIKRTLKDTIVIGNGDIKTKEDAKKAFEVSGVDGIMIGRAAVGAPWIFSEMLTLFGEENKTYNVKEIIMEHIHDVCQNYGEGKGAHFMRKFIMKYLSHIDGVTREDKLLYMKCEDEKSFIDLLQNIKQF